MKAPRVRDGTPYDPAVVDSISKTRIDRAQAERIARRSFPERSLVTLTECTDGWFNAVHRLGFDDGSSAILKIAPPPDVQVLRYEHDIITTEVETLRLLGERTDLPVPEVLAWDPSREIVSSPYFVMTTCPGVPLEGRRSHLDPVQSAAVDAQLAAFVATVNTIPGSHFGRPEPSAPRCATWHEAFGLLIADLLADAVDAAVSLPRPVDELAALTSRLIDDTLPEVTEPLLVHWDLWDTNVFLDPDTLEVVGVIDFERALWGDPLMEAQFVGRRAHDDIVEAYGTRLFDRPGAADRRRLYDLYLYLVMVVESAYRNYDTDDIEQLGRAMLDLTLDEIDSRSAP